MPIRIRREPNQKQSMFFSFSNNDKQWKPGKVEQQLAITHTHAQVIDKYGFVVRCCQFANAKEFLKRERKTEKEYNRVKSMCVCLCDVGIEGKKKKKKGK